MEAKELRISNWVWDSITQKPIKVNGELIRWKEQNDKSLNSNPFDIGNIPLTEEWLLKFGKTELGILIQSHDYPHGDLYVDYDDNGTNLRLKNCREGLEFGVELKYVHQLQNLYHALTGKELEEKELTIKETV